MTSSSLTTYSMRALSLSLSLPPSLLYYSRSLIYSRRRSWSVTRTLSSSTPQFPPVTSGSSTPFSPTPPTFWPGKKAMVVNLEFIKAIVTAEEVLLLDPLSQEVLPFADQLRRPVPEVLLYHEPTAGLDHIASTVVEDLIRSVHMKGEDVHGKPGKITSYVVVTHQHSTIKRAVDRLLFLYGGRIVWEGMMHEFTTSTYPLVCVIPGSGNMFNLVSRPKSMVGLGNDAPPSRINLVSEPTTALWFVDETGRSQMQQINPGFTRRIRVPPPQGNDGDIFYVSHPSMDFDACQHGFRCTPNVDEDENKFYFYLDKFYGCTGNGYF